MSVRTINEDLWQESYKPKPNHMDATHGWDFGDGCCLYETYGEELEYIKQLVEQGKSAYIWTVIETDGVSVIESGVHIINRLGYIVTENPCRGSDIISVELEDLAA